MKPIFWMTLALLTLESGCGSDSTLQEKADEAAETAIEIRTPAAEPRKPEAQVTFDGNFTAEYSRIDVVTKEDFLKFRGANQNFAFTAVELLVALTEVEAVDLQSFGPLGSPIVKAPDLKNCDAFLLAYPLATKLLVRVKLPSFAKEEDYSNCEPFFDEVGKSGLILEFPNVLYKGKPLDLAVFTLKAPTKKPVPLVQ